MEDAAGVATTVPCGWLAWEVEGKPVSVRVSLGVAGRLGMAIREGFKALPRRGLETGGLLIGRRTRTGNHVVVDIDDFEPIESEHVTGPSYVLSDADLRLLEAKIAACEAASIVGFYRSHTRPGFAISDEDAALFSAYFPSESDVFLLLKPNDFGPPTGGFVIREGGEVLSDSPYAEFTLDWVSALTNAHETPAPALPELPTPSLKAPSTPPASRIGRHFKVPATTRTVQWPIWRVATLAALAMVVFSYGILRRGPVPAASLAGTSPAPGPALALNVTSTANSLRLTWDHAPGAASGGVLWIKDGKEEQRLELDSRQLSEGSLVYWPRNCDVTFRLELLSPGAAMTESVRAVGGPCKPAVVAPPPTAAAVPAPTALQPKDSSTHLSAAPPPKQPPRNRIGETSRQVSSVMAAPQPASQTHAVAPPSLPEPPSVRPAAAPAQPQSAEVLREIAPARLVNDLRNGADPPVRIRVEPVSGSLIGQVGRNIPLLGKRYRRSDFVPPAPLHNPPLPAAPRNLAKPVNIDVKVHVDAQGKVEFAEIAARVARAEPDLADLAAASAQQCEFVAARTADGPVPGVVIIHYQFGPVAPGTGNQPLAAR